jgi:hypothetical protein
MNYKEIVYVVDQYVATVTMNRPEKLNAMTPLMAGEIRDAVFRAAEDDKGRVVILTGAGTGFCAGADMAGLKDAADQGTSFLKGAGDPEEAVSNLMGIKTEEQREGTNRYDARSDFRKRFSYFLSFPKRLSRQSMDTRLAWAYYCPLLRSPICFRDRPILGPSCAQRPCRRTRH